MFNNSRDRGRKKIDNIAHALAKGGIKVVEVTFNTAGASNMISYMTKKIIVKTF